MNGKLKGRMIVLTRQTLDLGHLMLVRSSQQVSTELDGETVILNIASGMYSGLDPIGTAVWGLLEKPIAFSDIVKMVCANYDVSEEHCVDDMLVFLNQLNQKNLIDMIEGKI